MSDLESDPAPPLRQAPSRLGNGTGRSDPQQDLLHALQAMRSGDFSVRMSGDYLGIDGKIADTFNEIIAANERMAQQLERVGQVVGREGKTRQRVRFGLASGSWADMESSVNTLIDDLLWPTREVTRAVAAVAQGDLLQTVKLDVDGRPLGGEFLQSANIVNTMIKQLSVFTSEVTAWHARSAPKASSAARPRCRR
jgi:methyl-accepting chemotaxis protein